MASPHDDFTHAARTSPPPRNGEPGATVERWRRARAVFDAVIADPGAPRRRLAELCGDDRALRRDVAALLRRDGGPERFLAVSIPEALAGPEARVGSILGGYRLERLLARGGSSEVYLARRPDGDAPPVAVKLLRGRIGERTVLRRFLNEVRVLAGLEHPSIARILDVGASDEGSPYLIVEYVLGEPITEHCDARRLDLAARVALIRRVAAAVAFAHRSLVVHRDLKPANVLVSADGTPKVIDFGIAKVLEPVREADTTDTVERVLTPSYASPEHLRGDRLTTATDVYSLGVVLYQLLCGRLPFDWRGRSLGEITAALAQREAEPPSVALTRSGDDVAPGAEVIAGDRGSTVEGLRHRLAGDLDAIALQALRREPGERYRTVDELAGDLGRWLAGDPISARPPSAADQLRKLARRNPRTTLAAGLGAALVLGLAFTAGVQSWRLARERDAARRDQRLAQSEGRRAESVTRFLLEAIDAATPEVARGETLTVRELLDGVAARLRLELADQPATRALLLRTVAEAYLRLGALDPAGTLAQEALTEARHLPAEGSGGAPAPPVADALALLAFVSAERGDRAAAEELAAEALALRRGALGERHPDVAASLRQVADLAASRDDLEAALRTIEQALAIDRAASPDPGAEVAEDLATLALVRYRRQELEEAEAAAREALAIVRRLYGDVHPGVASALNLLAGIRLRRGDLAAAELQFRQALELRRRLLGADHPWVATSLLNLGTVLLERGRYGEAAGVYEEAVALDRKNFAHDPARWTAGLASRGSVLAYLGRLPEAIAALEEARAIERRQEPSETLWTIESSLAVALTMAGRTAAAGALLEENLQARRRRFGEDSLQAANALHCRGYLRAEIGELDGAAEDLERAAALHERGLGREHPLTARTLHTLAEVELGRGHRGRARELVEAALATRRRILEPGHPDTAVNLVLRAEVALAEGAFGSARDDARQAIGLLPASFGLEHPRLAEARLALADALAELGDFGGAGHEASQAETILDRAFPAGHWRRAEADNVLGMTRLAIRPDGAATAAFEASGRVLAETAAAGEWRRQRVVERRTLLRRRASGVGA